MHFYVINGPNLNFLGIREPHIYGNDTLITLEENIEKYIDGKEINVSFFQANGEGKIIDCLQHCYRQEVDGIIINPGAYTHYSYAIADAIKSINIPTVEVHISNIYAREKFRQHSVTATSCLGVISGFGFNGYILALEQLLFELNQKITEKTVEKNEDLV